MNSNILCLEVVVKSDVVPTHEVSGFCYFVSIRLALNFISLRFMLPQENLENLWSTEVQTETRLCLRIVALG